MKQHIQLTFIESVLSWKLLHTVTRKLRKSVLSRSPGSGGEMRSQQCGAGCCRPDQGRAWGLQDAEQDRHPQQLDGTGHGNPLKTRMWETLRSPAQVTGFVRCICQDMKSVWFQGEGGNFILFGMVELEIRVGRGCSGDVWRRRSGLEGVTRAASIGWELWWEEHPLTHQQLF